MRYGYWVLLLGSSVLSGAAHAATAIPPIITGSPTAAQINQRCNWFVARSTTLRKALETSKGKASVATTLAAYDKLGEVIGDGGGEAGFYREVAMTAAARTAALARFPAGLPVRCGRVV